MRRLTLAEADELRRTPGATLALFLTDRCPVGCAHCSVSSTVDGPTIRDWDLFGEIVAGIAALPAVQAVAITGGEPFAERRGLIHAVRHLSAAGKAVVLFTSGHWARPTVPAWVPPVLELTSTVYLSTDSFHRAGLTGSPGRDPGPRLRTAVETIAAAGCHLVLQVLDEPGARAAAHELCPAADVNVVAPLSAGRGAAVFPSRPAVPAPGRCGLLNSPTIRYDGQVTACCNETVIMGGGPDGLRRRVTEAGELAPALAGLRADPVLRLMGRYGPAALESVMDSQEGTMCQMCWTAQERAATDVRALAALTFLAGARLAAPGHTAVGGDR